MLDPVITNYIQGEEEDTNNVKEEDEEEEDTTTQSSPVASPSSSSTSEMSEPLSSSSPEEPTTVKLDKTNLFSELECGSCSATCKIGITFTHNLWSCVCWFSCFCVVFVCSFVSEITSHVFIN